MSNLDFLASWSLKMTSPTIPLSQALECDPTVRRIRSQYGMNPAKRPVELTIDYKSNETRLDDQTGQDSVGNWVMKGQTVADGMPITHTVKGNGSYELNFCKSELTEHIRMFADAYTAGERWE